ncbi:hypothetical protein [Actinophytocola glycyrrhizae]|uniref:PPE family protein n=1 Tax=Actinophytocola glycyrrhizae TaxID=2044873 RepID=A0ABV9S177_9PSEU
MDFLDTVTDGIDNAVGAVLAPVADTAGAAAGTLRRELRQTWHGVFGSPTPPGGTNWNAYSHEELTAMVRTGADPGQVGEQSAVLDGLGRGAHDCADELTSRRQQVPDVWQGQASGAFGSTLDEHRAGGAAVAEHAAALSAAVLRASEALSRAQARMPEPVDVGAATSYGALTGGAAAGPAFAVGAVSGAGTSWFGASLLAANKKAEAVEVMQAFEQSLVAADPPDAPAKVPPGVPGGGQLPSPRPEAVAVPVTAPRPATPNVARADSTPARAPQTASSPAVSTASSPATPSSAAPSSATAASAAAIPAAPGASATGGAPGTGQVTHPAGIAVGPGGGQARATRPSAAPGWVSGPDGRAMGGPVAWRELVGRGTTPGLVTDTERPARPVTPGAVPATSRREDDREHHNRMPRADKLFTLDDRTPPPVIGA